MRKYLLAFWLLLFLLRHAEAGRFLKGTRSGSSSQAMSWTAPVYDAGVGAGAVSCSFFTLKGYRTLGLVYSTATPSFQRSTADCVTLTLTATSIAAGVWYWTVTATDSAGNESDPHPEVVKTAP